MLASVCWMLASPGTCALKTRQRPSVLPVARYTLPGCHATDTMLLSWRFLMILHAHHLAEVS